MAYTHWEEEFQAGVLLGYEREHPGSRYLIEFDDGESDICRLDTAYESDNAGEFDIEDDHPFFDEFLQVSMEIIEVRARGLRPWDEWLNLDYRDWPARITDIDRGVVVCPPTPT